MTMTRTESERGTSPGTLEAAEISRKDACLTTEYPPGVPVGQELEALGWI